MNDRRMGFHPVARKARSISGLPRYSVSHISLPFQLGRVTLPPAFSTSSASPNDSPFIRTFRTEWTMPRANLTAAPASTEQ